MNRINEITIILENKNRGGLDKFLLDFTKNISNKLNKINILCNVNHPGKIYIKKNIPKKINLIFYKGLTREEIYNKLLKYFKLKILCKIIYFIFGFFYQYKNLRKMLVNLDSNNLFVITGGYPGGDIGLLSIIIWGLIKKKPKIWLNFHNNAVSYSQNILISVREKIIDHFVRKYVNKFISVSNSSALSLENRNKRFNGRNISYIYNGIEKINPLSTINLRNKYKFNKNSRIILLLANYEKRKGHEFALQIMKYLNNIDSNIKLLIFGDDSNYENLIYKNKIINLISKFNLENNVILNSFTTNVDNILSQTDIIISTSQEYESFGYSILEGMSCGIPSVVTNVGGLPEVTKDNFNGFVIKNYDYKDFANKILILLNDKSIYTKFSVNSFNRFKSNFSINKMINSYINIIES